MTKKNFMENLIKKIEELREKLLDIWRLL